MNKIKNNKLKKDLNSIIENNTLIKLGDCSGNSIELIDNPITHTSYIYYNRKGERDNDFRIISELLNKNNSQ
jgi:hypothetical protein